MWQTSLLIFPDEWLHALLSSGLPRTVDREHTLQFANLRRLVFDDSNIASSCWRAIDGARTPLGSKIPAEVRLPLYETMQHIMKIARGWEPGFAPALRDDSDFGPFAAFQDFLVQDVKAAPYFPVVLHPRHVTQAGSFAYYSMRQRFSLQNVKPRSQIESLSWLAAALSKLTAREAESLTWDYLSGERQRDKKVATKLYEAISHPNAFRRELLPSEDDSLRLYADHPFFKACVRIAAA